MMTEDEIRGLKVVELKAKLAKYGLVQTGRKDELIDRLLENLNQNEGQTAGNSAVPKQQPAAQTSVPSGAVNQTQQQATLQNSVALPANDEDARRLARASRFGITPVAFSAPAPVKGQKTSSGTQDIKASKTLAADPSLNAPDARLRRIERFGVVEQPFGKKARQEPGSKMAKAVAVEGVEVDLESLKARQDRFGVTTSKVLAQTEAELARQRRMERFAGGNQ